MIDGVILGVSNSDGNQRTDRHQSEFLLCFAAVLLNELTNLKCSDIQRKSYLFIKCSSLE